MRKQDARGEPANTPGWPGAPRIKQLPGGTDVEVMPNVAADQSLAMSDGLAGSIQVGG
jgi:hypothetical protein